MKLVLCIRFGRFRQKELRADATASDVGSAATSIILLVQCLGLLYS